MKKNMGTADRIVRLALAAVVAALYATSLISGTAGTILVILAVIFAATSALGFCPLYAIVGISTRKKSTT